MDKQVQWKVKGTLQERHGGLLPLEKVSLLYY